MVSRCEEGTPCGCQAKYVGTPRSSSFTRLFLNGLLVSTFFVSSGWVDWEQLRETVWYISGTIKFGDGDGMVTGGGTIENGFPPHLLIFSSHFNGKTIPTRKPWYVPCWTKRFLFLSELVLAYIGVFRLRLFLLFFHTRFVSSGFLPSYMLPTHFSFRVALLPALLMMRQLQARCPETTTHFLNTWALLQDQAQVGALCSVIYDHFLSLVLFC